MSMSASASANGIGESTRSVPWQLWVVITLLALEGISNLLMGLAYPIAFVWLAAKCLFITGFVRGWRPVFVIFLLVAGLHVLSSTIIGGFGALLNLAMMILVASAYRHFFSRGSSA